VGQLDIDLPDIDGFELGRRLVVVLACHHFLVTLPVIPARRVAGARDAQASGRARIAHPVGSCRGSPAFPPGTSNQVLHRGH
jgi:hypothetical protein